MDLDRDANGRVAYRMTRFKRWHLPRMLEWGDSEGGFYQPDAYTMQYMEKEPNNWTLVVGNMPLLCGGTMAQWPHRHTSWAFLNKHSGPHMAAVVRRARWIIRQPGCRVDMTVRKDFAAGHKFARVLGYRVETPLLPKYGPEGEDHVGYVFLPEFDEEK